MEGFMIREAAAILKVSQSTLRRYEARGLLPQAKRHPLGWRLYNLEDIRELQRRLAPTTDHAYGKETVAA